MTTPSTSIQAEAAEPDREHDEHQRPAAADTEQTVRDAHPERLEPLVAAAPVGEDEPERGAALVEAVVLERRELVEAGDGEGRGRDHGAVLREPRRRSTTQVQDAIGELESDTERRPDREVCRRRTSPTSSAGLRRRATSAPKVEISGTLVGSIIATIITVQPTMNSAASAEPAVGGGRGVVVEEAGVRRLAPEPEREPRGSDSAPSAANQRPALPASARAAR